MIYQEVTTVDVLLKLIPEKGSGPSSHKGVWAQNNVAPRTKGSKRCLHFFAMYNFCHGPVFMTIPIFISSPKKISQQNKQQSYHQEQNRPRIPW